MVDLSFPMVCAMAVLVEPFRIPYSMMRRSSRVSALPEFSVIKMPPLWKFVVLLPLWGREGRESRGGCVFRQVREYPGPAGDSFRGNRSGGRAAEAAFRGLCNRLADKSQGKV